MAYDANFDGFLRVAQTIVNDNVRALNGDDTSMDVIEIAISQLNALWRNVGRMNTLYPQCDGLLEDLQSLIRCIENMKSSQQEHIGIRLAKFGDIGRPRYLISREQLEFLTEMGFSMKTMASLLHVSVSSIKRRLSSYRISLRRKYADISDDDLDENVRRVTKFNSSIGQRIVQGILKSEGIFVQRERIAESLIRVDEAGVAMRWCRIIRRRSYRVSGPNALWHIDGNHKLIRWGMVIHGGIDGFSRAIVFLRLALDNKASTAFIPFADACHEFGIPSRIRTDHGLENIDIAAFMIAQRGPNRGSVITGKSVHNQRIERLWRDMFNSCTHVFYHLFYFLERSGYLDMTSEIQLWCLQYVYKPRIQAALGVFKEGWNNHRLGSEHGQTPMQLFVRTVLQQVGQGHRGIDDLFSNDMLNDDVDNYGIDWNGPLPENDQEAIVVPQIACPISQERYRQLEETVNPLSENDGLGISLYLRSLALCAD